MNHWKILDESTDNDLLLVGPVALYGGKDLTLEDFGPDTDFDSDYIRSDAVLVDWEHGIKPDPDIVDGKPTNQPGRDDVLGKVDVTSLLNDPEFGLLAKYALDRRKKYVSRFIEPLAKANLLGTSSEAVPDGVVKSEDGHIKSWPLKRVAFTVNPMEPRMLTEAQLEVVKALSNDLPALKSLIAEDAQESMADVVEADDNPILQSEVIMADKAKGETPTVDVDLSEIENGLKTVNERLDGMGLDDIKTTLAQVIEKLDQMPAPKKAGVVEVIEDEEDKPQFKSLGEFLQLVAANPSDQRLRSAKSQEPGLGGHFDVEKAIGRKAVGSLYARKQEYLKAAPTGLGESSQPSEGGFLVGTDRMSGILARTYDVGNLLQRVDMVPISADSNGMTFNAEDETSRAAGSRRGGIRAYWVAENSAITASQPKFRQMELKLQKAGALVYATDELLADASALEGWIMSNLPEELAFLVEDGIIRGTGAGQPLGILNAGCVVSIAKETGQAAATIVAKNISKMWARRWLGGRNYVWLVNQDVEPELDNLSYAVGTGGSLVYMPAGGLSGAPYGSIKGRPVIPVEYCATLGTVGDIILADLGEFQMIEKGGVQSASSIHVRFTQDETVFRFVYRVDGQPKWDAALTPYQGTNTVSPFVTLATRA